MYIAAYAVHESCRSMPLGQSARSDRRRPIEANCLGERPLLLGGLLLGGSTPRKQGSALNQIPSVLDPRANQQAQTSRRHQAAYAHGVAVDTQHNNLDKSSQTLGTLSFARACSE